jgi:hypothetical protein
VLGVGDDAASSSAWSAGPLPLVENFALAALCQLRYYEGATIPRQIACSDKVWQIMALGQPHRKGGKVEH